jgi:zeaxanthin glucosyltransferase
MTALARKLQSRGHEVVSIGVPDIEPVVRAANLEFAPFCENEYPLGSVPKHWGAVATMHGLDAVRYTGRELTPPLLKASLERLPANSESQCWDSLFPDENGRARWITAKETTVRRRSRADF